MKNGYQKSPIFQGFQVLEIRGVLWKGVWQDKLWKGVWQDKLAISYPKSSF
jgi:hypothetical protein